jgi:hypothetical protein
LRLRIRASQPRPAKPASAVAQVEGSGMALMLKGQRLRRPTKL